MLETETYKAKLRSGKFRMMALGMGHGRLTPTAKTDAMTADISIHIHHSTIATPDELRIVV